MRERHIWLKPIDDENAKLRNLKVERLKKVRVFFFFLVLWSDKLKLLTVLSENQTIGYFDIKNLIFGFQTTKEFMGVSDKRICL